MSLIQEGEKQPVTVRETKYSLMDYWSVVGNSRIPEPTRSKMLEDIKKDIQTIIERNQPAVVASHSRGRNRIAVSGKRV